MAINPQLHSFSFVEFRDAGPHNSSSPHLHAVIIELDVLAGKRERLTLGGRGGEEVTRKTERSGYTIITFMVPQPVPGCCTWKRLRVQEDCHGVRDKKERRLRLTKMAAGLYFTRKLLKSGTAITLTRLWFN